MLGVVHQCEEGEHREHARNEGEPEDQPEGADGSAPWRRCAHSSSATPMQRPATAPDRVHRTVKAEGPARVSGLIACVTIASRSGLRRPLPNHDTIGPPESAAIPWPGR